MATWVLGDLHGQRNTLDRLLPRLNLDPKQDELWLVGDLVNRGPDSLGVLRWARATALEWGPGFRVVLGNHDVRLIAWHLEIGKPRPKDQIDDILGAPDRGELVEWLQEQPLLLHRGNHLMVHAGIHPSWDLATVRRRSRAAETFLRGPSARRLLEIYDGGPAGKDPALAEAAMSLQVLTKIRTLQGNGKLCGHKGHPTNAPAGCLPWFSHPERRLRDTRILFGHWAALGLHRTEDTECLDAGAAWKGSIAALHLETAELVLEPVNPAPGA